MTAHGRNHWIKLYVEMNHDPKIGLLTDDLKWRFVSVLLLAGEIDDGGFLPEINDMAWKLHAVPETVAGQMRTLAQRGLVELKQHADGSERWFVTHFAERQAPSTNAERQRLWRKRSSSDHGSNEAVTKRNAKVTQELPQKQKQKQKQKQNTETEQQQKRAVAAAAAGLPAEYTEMLQRHGIDHAKTWSELAPVLLEVDDAETLVEECIAAARALKTTNPVGFAIDWLLQGNTQPPPVRARSGARDLARQVPAEYEHLVVR